MLPAEGGGEEGVGESARQNGALMVIRRNGLVNSLRVANDTRARKISHGV